MIKIVQFILGSLAVLCVIAANGIHYRVKWAIRKKGYPVSWLNYPGMHSDLASLAKIIAAAPSAEEALAYRRLRRWFYLSYAVFGAGVVLCVIAAISSTFGS